MISLLSAWPYNVRSRYSEALLENLSRDDHPIICEVLHTCYVLADKRFSHRLKIYREVNIEHDYYRHLALGEKNILKKIYLRLEAAKLRRFEPTILKADQVAVVSAADQSYFRQRYPSLQTALVPCFHEFDEVRIIEGQSDYILYHGNLGVSENYMAADWLIDHVFSRLTCKVVIAGLNPPAFLKHKIARHAHIALRENCTPQDMTQLIEQAQVHVLYTGQATGLKLKLLNVLYRGRFVVANTAMLSGTSLHAACTVADTPEAYIKAIDELMQTPFTAAAAETRKQLVKAYDNAEKINTLLGMMPL